MGSEAMRSRRKRCSMDVTPLDGRPRSDIHRSQPRSMIVQLQGVR